MITSGYKGISFPFRVSKQGGVVMSTTSRFDSRHIDESIKQILNTHYLERTMESGIYSQLDRDIFEPNDENLQTIMRAQIIEDLNRLEGRISIDAKLIEFSVVEEDGVEALYVRIPYVVTKYETQHVVKVKVGEN